MKNDKKGETPGSDKPDVSKDELDCMPIVSRLDDKNMTPPGREEDGADIFYPQPSNTGVEKLEILEFGLDWLEFTLYTDRMKALEIYAKIFADILGDLILEGYSKYYAERYINGGGFQLLAVPKQIKGFETNARFIFPGSICQAIPLEKFTEFTNLMAGEDIRLKCTRIDIKVDYCPFKPFDIARDIETGKAETRAERKTLKKYDLPYDIDDLGGIGTQGITLGSRESEKYLRIYNKHGFTRLELECKGDAANSYFYILQQAEDDFPELAMGIILDFIRIDADYWREFSARFGRAYIKTKIYTDPTLENLEKFIITQGSIAIGILLEIKGEKWLRGIAKNGLERARQKTKYYPLLHAYGIADE